MLSFSDKKSAWGWQELRRKHLKKETKKKKKKKKKEVVGIFNDIRNYWEDTESIKRKLNLYYIIYTNMYTHVFL